MLRHIYISERVNYETMDEHEKREIADQMMHSTSMQNRYKWTQPGICDAVKALCTDCNDKKKKEKT